MFSLTIVVFLSLHLYLLVRVIANVVLKVLYEGLKLKSDERFQEIQPIGGSACKQL